MPNQPNYRSNITNVLDKTFSPSRIVRFPQDTVLLEILPAAFGFDAESTIEIHFYSQPANILQLSLVIEPSDIDILKSHVVTHPDGTLQHYLRINFTELFERKTAVLLPGEYKVVMNFFANEIGSYNNRSLFVQQISDSRTEVQLAFFETNDETIIQQNQKHLQEFIEPSFDKLDAVGVAEKVFFSGVNLEDESEGITFSNLPDTIETAPESFGNVIERLTRVSPQLRVQFEEQINTAIQNIYTRVKENIIEFGDFRIQRNELDIFIQDAVTKEVETLRLSADPRIKIQ
jgi:hypothetical protein